MSSMTGQEMYRFIDDVFPYCRSITGDGVRQTLARMKAEIPLSVVEIPSGTKVFDWEVPLEWNISDAYIEDADGHRAIELANNNLHIVSYSSPIDDTFDFEELNGHLHTDSRNPAWIPYRTGYYARDWGFCLSSDEHDSLLKSKYKVKIDSQLTHGSLSYGELRIPGISKSEILIYSHTCHPSLANDNLSGLAVTTWLAKLLLGGTNRYSYRFVWGPGTIGSLTWLSQNEAHLTNIKHVLVCCLLGRPGAIHYKRSPTGCCDIDELAAWVLNERKESSVILDYEPYGYDERQFSSPGIRLPTGRVSRLPNDCYPEYHSSADNMDLIEATVLADSLDCLATICNELDSCIYYRNLAPKGEPQLGRRGLYDAVGGRSPANRQQMMLWLLNQSDGKCSLQRIARRTGYDISDLKIVANQLERSGLLAIEDFDREGYGL